MIWASDSVKCSDAYVTIANSNALGHMACDCGYFFMVPFVPVLLTQYECLTTQAASVDHRGHLVYVFHDLLPHLTLTVVGC